MPDFDFDFDLSDLPIDERPATSPAPAAERGIMNIRPTQLIRFEGTVVAVVRADGEIQVLDRRFDVIVPGGMMDNMIVDAEIQED